MKEKYYENTEDDEQLADEKAVDAFAGCMWITITAVCVVVAAVVGFIIILIKR